MSKTIDERVVEMRFDNSKFEANAQTTMSTLDKLKQALKLDGAAKGFEEIGQAAGNVKMDAIGSACETVQTRFSALQVVAMTALANIANDAVNAGKKIVSALTIDGAKDGFAEYELKMGSVQTIMNGTGESLQTVMTYLEELNKYADQTIYSFSDMTSNIGKFTNAGVKLEDAVAAIKGVSNEAAVSGANANEASRAMYNFAQALSAGYVKLIDWKSIENANMATVEFKNELIKTGVELGTLVKDEDMFITTTTNAKGKISSAFDATHSFNEALENQWMTTEVLTKTLAKYADENTELGQKAYDAATKVKTFSMMIDTLKEAVGSGWATTWEKIIGDFDQATDVFTEITNTLSEVIEQQADSRNKFLDAAFNPKTVGIKEWNTMMASAGKSADLYRDKIIEMAEKSGISINDLLEQYGSLEDSLQSGWLSQDLFNEINNEINKLAASDSKFAALAQSINKVGSPLHNLVLEMSELSGRQHVVNSLKNIFEALTRVIKPIKEAFREIFPPKTAQDLKDALGTFEEFTESLKISDEQANKVKETFRGFFNVISKGLDTVKRIINAFSPLKDIFITITSNLLEGTHSLGAFFNSIGEGSNEVSLFQTVLDNIHSVLETFSNNLQGYIDKIKDGWSKLRNMFSESLETGALSVLSGLIKNIKESLSGFTNGIGKGFSNFLDQLNKGFSGEGIEKVTNVLSKFADGLKQVWSKLSGALKPITDALRDFFTDFDIIDSLAAGIKGGVLATFASWIGQFIDNILDFKDQVGVITNPVETICGVVQQLTDLFGSIEEKMRVSVVKDFALSVGILAAAIFALASIKAEDASRAVGIVAGLIGTLTGIFVALKKFNDMKNIDGISTFVSNIKTSINDLLSMVALSQGANAIMKIAFSVVILAAALKMISNIDSGSLWQSFAVITLLVGELTAVSLAFSKMEGRMTKGAGTLIALAAAVTILAGAMKILENISWEDMCKGLLAVTILLGELVLAMMVLDGKSLNAGGMFVAALALTVLAGAMKIYETMDWEGIGKGLVTIGGLLLELGVALTLMDASLPGAAALLVASAAIVVLAGALKLIETIDSKSILPILGMIGGVLLELAGGMALMTSALPGAAALIVAAGAIAILVPALMALSAVPAKNIYKAIGEIAVALLAFGGVSAILGLASPLILAFAAALLVLSVAVLGMGAGLALAGAGLTALAASFGILSEVSKESAERFVETLQIILKGIISLIPDMLTAFGEGLIKLCDVIVAGGPSIKAALQTITEILIQVFSDNIPKMNEAFMQMLTSMLQSLATYGPQMAQAFYELLIGCMNTFLEFMPQMIEVGTQIVVAFIQGIQQSQNQIIDAAMQAVIAFINGLAESITNNTPQLIEAVNNLFNAVIDAMLLILSNGNPEFVVKAHELMNSLRQGINDKVGEAKSAVTKMVNDMVQAITTKVNEFRDAAGQLVNGFVNGIKEKVSAAKEAVSSFATDVVTALKNALDIHSPSRVAAELGSYFGQGFTEGMREETGNVSSSSAELATSATTSMEEALNNMASVVNAKAPEFQRLGATVMRNFVTGIQNESQQVPIALTQMFQKMELNMEAQNSTVTMIVKEMINSMIKIINENYVKFGTCGSDLVNKLIQGMKLREYNARLQCISICTSCVTAFRNEYTQFYSAGQYLVEGFIQGISSKIQAAADEAARMAKAASAAAKANLQIKSPSRVFKRIGEYVGEGFIWGMENYEDKSGLAGARLAMAAVIQASEMVENNLDVDPTITPVIDLTNVEEGTKKINAMLSKTQAMEINANLRGAEAVGGAGNVAQSTNQNITFTQNNYSPKALSRIEIYRQTNNQISQMKGVLA